MPLFALLRLAPILVVLALLCGCQNPPEPGPNYREFAYVTNGGSDTVTAIDLRALRVATTIHVGKAPTGIAINPTRNEIYVANTDSNNISVIDAESNQVVSTIGVHRAPFFVDGSADGNRAYVANSGSANLSASWRAPRISYFTLPVWWSATAI